MLAHVGRTAHHPSICESVAALEPNAALLSSQVCCRAKLVGRQRSELSNQLPSFDNKFPGHLLQEALEVDPQ
jgi:hypothetical protein